jgi:peroxiredoxin
MGVTAVAILAVSYMANRPAAGGRGLTSVVLSGSASGPAPEVGEAAPDLAATTVEGAKVALSKLRGHPVWLTFGASWCQPCRAENPDIQAAYERYRAQGLEVLAIYIQDDASTIRDYAGRTGLTYPKVDDADTRIASSYRILGIPSHFFIDSSGVLRELRIGSLDPEGIDTALGEIGVDVD